MAKSGFNKFTPPKSLLKSLAWIIIIVFLGLFGLVVLGDYIHKQDAPLRNGISALKGGDYALAFKELYPLAKNGNYLAQESLGDIHAFGWGVPLDEIKAEIWYRRADTNCLSKYDKRICIVGQSEYGVAQCYLTGCYGEKDPSIAKRWLIRSAEAGNLEAQQFLADSSKLTKFNLKVDPKVMLYWKDYISSNKIYVP
jgi:TPR repeat protein